ncbi:MAG: hypothetical protein E6J20_07475 [Chloroflexi bacterium]|nr:MAG: hypothetical protein E6J20_07475 [Chloroflexota bacterium]
MGRQTESRDLRSLERRSMYSIFHPLDTNERLPRELVLEGRRHRLFGIRQLEMAGYLYLPCLVLLVVFLASIGVNPLIAFAVAGLLLVGFYVYSLAARYR